MWYSNLLSLEDENRPSWPGSIFRPTALPYCAFWILAYSKKTNLKHLSENYTNFLFLHQRFEFFWRIHCAWGVARVVENQEFRIPIFVWHISCHKLVQGLCCDFPLGLSICFHYMKLFASKPYLRGIGAPTRTENEKPSPSLTETDYPFWFVYLIKMTGPLKTLMTKYISSLVPGAVTKVLGSISTPSKWQWKLAIPWQSCFRPRLKQSWNNEIIKFRASIPTMTSK